MENNNLKLWYPRPASKWLEALPLGNGKLGAMVFGDVKNERIQFNEEMLWTGSYKKQDEKSEHLKDLEKARKLIFEGKYIEGQKIVNEKLLGPWNESYAPMGNLYLDFDNSSLVQDYKRELDLEDSVMRITYKIGETNFKREIFISSEENTLIINLECNQKNQLNFKVRLDSLLRFNVKTIDNSTMIMRGYAPIHAIPSYVPTDDAIFYSDNKEDSIQFEVMLNIENFGGSIESKDDQIIVKDADRVIIRLTGCTDYNKEANNEKINSHDVCTKTINECCNKSYDDILNNHLKEYKELFSRVSLKLESSDFENLPTDERLEGLKKGNEDLGLYTLYFQYARYLLISSSRKGTEPANLQGIWNEDIRPAWSSNYTTNINVEMNYWPAEVTNLSQCHEPLFELIKEISEKGRKTAKEWYGCRGWTANHNVDLWRQTEPAGGSAECSYWPMAGAWLCSHLWQHYEFTLDKEFLKQAYPIMKEAAVFLLDYLVKDENGYYVTCPSTTPENNFLTDEGEKCSVSIASTMDMSLIRNLFKICIKAIEILEIDFDFKDKLKEVISLLYPYKIGKYGQLQEWFKDFDEFEKGHRHLSHLIGLYPFAEINENDNREIYEAARSSLKIRLEFGGGETGWSCAWIINLFARLKDSESAYKYLNVLLKRSTFSNLFNNCPPFQIDGNFGGCAGISEMLLQSHLGYVELLPALPKAWKTGEVTGLKARNAFEVSIKWENNKIINAEVKSLKGSKFRIKSFDELKVLSDENKPIKVTEVSENIFEFETEANKKYILSKENNEIQE